MTCDAFESPASRNAFITVSRIALADLDDRASSSLNIAARTRASRLPASTSVWRSWPSTSSCLGSRRQVVEVDRDAGARGERHLAQRGEEAAVGAVVVGEDLLRALSDWIAAKKP
jgi:hypothetical protein